MQISQRWWDQIALDILGVRAAHVAVNMGEETGIEDSDGKIDQDTEGRNEDMQLQEPEQKSQRLGG